MAEGFLGNLMSGIFPQNQRDLDEEERRMIEEMRAAGAYVPRERPVNYLQYGGGRRRDENLAAMRAAIQPEKARRLADVMDARGAALRQRQALEEFNQKQNFAREIARQNRAIAIQDEARRRELGQQQKKADAGFQEWIKSGDSALYDKSINTMTPRQRAELEVLNRAATPALAAQTQLGSSQLDLASKQRADELASAVHNALRGTNYSDILANNMFLDARLKNSLNQTRLDLAQSPLARQLEESKMDKSLITLELEKANLRYQKELYKDVPALRDQLKLLEIQLLEAERDLKQAQAANYRAGVSQLRPLTDAERGARAMGGIVGGAGELSTDEAQRFPPGNRLDPNRRPPGGTH